jgi:hypothetical protein
LSPRSVSISFPPSYTPSLHSNVSFAEAIINPVENTVGGVAGDVTSKVNAILPLLRNLVVVLQSFLSKITGQVVTSVGGDVNSTENLTVEELGVLLKGVEADISGVLNAVTTLVGTAFPAVVTLIKTIM